MKSENAVFAFYYEPLDELVDRFYLLEKDMGKFDYQIVLELSDVLKIMESNNYKKVYISSVSVFDNLEEFFYFSEVVLGNGAHYFIDEEEVTINRGRDFNGNITKGNEI